MEKSESQGTQLINGGCCESGRSHFRVQALNPKLQFTAAFYSSHLKRTLRFRRGKHFDFPFKCLLLVKWSKLALCIKKTEDRPLALVASRVLRWWVFRSYWLFTFTDRMVKVSHTWSCCHTPAQICMMTQKQLVFISCSIRSQTGDLFQAGIWHPASCFLAPPSSPCGFHVHLHPCSPCSSLSHPSSWDLHCIEHAHRDLEHKSLLVSCHVCPWRSGWAWGWVCKNAAPRLATFKGIQKWWRTACETVKEAECKAVCVYSVTLVVLSCCLSVYISREVRQKDWKEVVNPGWTWPHGVTQPRPPAWRTVCWWHCDCDKDCALSCMFSHCNHIAPQYPSSIGLVWFSLNSNAELVIEYGTKSEFALKTFHFRNFYEI